MWFFETNEITQESVRDQIARLRDQVGSRPVTDQEIEQTREYIKNVRNWNVGYEWWTGTDDEWVFQDWEALVHKRNNQKMGIMQDTHGKINNLSWNNTIETQVLRNIVAYKKQAETLMNAPLTATNLSWFLKELPPENKDPLWRAFMVQTIVGKLRRDGYMLYTTGNGIVVESENESLRENAAVLQEALKSHMQHEYISYYDFDRAFVTGSESLDTYRSTQVNVNERNTGEYADFLMKKYNIDRQSVTDSKDITSRNDIPKEDQTFLVSYLANGIPPTTPLAPMLQNYDARIAEKQKFYESPAFVSAESAVNKAYDIATGAKIPTVPVNAEEAAREGTRDPSILAGRPLTTIAAGLAIVAGLGYEGKGKWFSFWTGLKRGFLAILTLFLGAGVMKEWDMDPKKLMNEGLDAMKKGTKSEEEKKEDKKSEETKSEEEKKEDKKSEEVKLTPAQQSLHDTLLANIDMKSKVNTFATEEKKKGPAGKTGTLEDYAKFISSSEFQNINPEHLFLNANHSESVFSLSPTLSSHVSLPDNLDPVVFKRVVRTYLTTQDVTTRWPDGKRDIGSPEKEAFLKEYNITPESVKDKKLKDVVQKIGEKGVGPADKPDPIIDSPTPKPLSSVPEIVVENAPTGLDVTTKVSADSKMVMINFSKEVIIGLEKKTTLTVMNTYTAWSKVRVNGVDYKMVLNKGKLTFEK